LENSRKREAVKKDMEKKAVNRKEESSMRAAKLTDVRKIEVTEAEKPQITSSREVLVEVRAVGICGTDLHIFQGERKDVSFPRVMGHELSGVVREIGTEVSRVAVGDRVVLDPVFACGECRICKSGHENVCGSVKCYGVQMDGGFQDYIVVEESHLYPFAEHVTFEQAALAEPFSIAANIMARTETKEGDRIVIIGSGTIGLCIAQAAKGLKARVLVADVMEAKLSRAIAAGADVTVNSKEKSLAEEVEKFAPGGADVVVDAVGIAELTEQMADLAAPVGRLAVIGFDERPAKIPPVKITKKELTIVGSRMNCHRFPQVMEWLEEGRIHADLMITRKYPVEEIQKAFEETLADGQGTVKTLILF
jgi:L-gulonate 5-dehydrogenase